jgi:hypothetical protein
MKVTIDIDCTPEEARAFLGLPDVRPMQDQLMADLQERMSASLKAMEPAEMLRTWLPTNLKSFEQMFDAFSRMGGTKRE